MKRIRLSKLLRHEIINWVNEWEKLKEKILEEIGDSLTNIAYEIPPLEDELYGRIEAILNDKWFSREAITDEEDSE